VLCGVSKWQVTGKSLAKQSLQKTRPRAHRLRPLRGVSAAPNPSLAGGRYLRSCPRCVDYPSPNRCGSPPQSAPCPDFGFPRSSGRSFQDQKHGHAALGSDVHRCFTSSTQHRFALCLSETASNICEQYRGPSGETSRVGFICGSALAVPRRNAICRTGRKGGRPPGERRARPRITISNTARPTRVHSTQHPLGAKVWSVRQNLSVSRPVGLVVLRRRAGSWCDGQVVRYVVRRSPSFVSSSTVLAGESAMPFAVVSLLHYAAGDSVRLAATANGSASVRG